LFESDIDALFSGFRASLTASRGRRNGDKRGFLCYENPSPNRILRTGVQCSIWRRKEYNEKELYWMSVYAELAGKAGVIAAGEYAYRGDRFNCKGQLDDEMARMASIMCRATTMGTHMQAEIMGANSDDCPFDPAHGWVVRGPQFTVCVVANVFCFLHNEAGSLNEIMTFMNERLADVHEMI